MTNDPGTLLTMSQLDRFLEVSVATERKKLGDRGTFKTHGWHHGTDHAIGNMWELAPGLLIEVTDMKAAKDSQKNLTPDFATLQFSTNTQILVIWHCSFIGTVVAIFLGASVHC